MTASFLQIAILAIVQGIAELLPVSSSAHVIVAETLMGLNPSAPEMTFLLVMLHTGTMFAVIAYFWRRWHAMLTAEPMAAGESAPSWATLLRRIAVATACTGVVGLGLKFFIEKVILSHIADAEVEHLFKDLRLIAMSLTGVGLLIIWSGLTRRGTGVAPLTDRTAAIIGVVQGLCLPFRGFSRSGATISVGMLQGIPRSLAESYSFALAVVLTPPVIVLQVRRLLKAAAASGDLQASASAVFVPGLLGMGLSFLAGLVALRWLSRWLEAGRWHFFGFYCLLAAAVTYSVHLQVTQ